ncbi:MAG: hypothetical protein KC442_10335 [Thermomicrobiales bacterium]|nr:hypothetical protein [Thermomicrobiales bacterium]
MLLMEIAVVASLVTSPIGALDARAIPAAADCGGRYQEDCGFDSKEEQGRLEERVYPTPTDEEIQERRLQRQRDTWADTHLAAERAVATWWRGRGPGYDPVSGRRGRGVLVEQVPGGRSGDALDFARREPLDREFIYYECDPNYDDAESGGCVPSDRDYDCSELRAWGIASIPVIGEDWMLLDDDGDGWGCEPIRTTQAGQAVVPTHEPGNQCDGVVGRLGCFLSGP